MALLGSLFAFGRWGEDRGGRARRSLLAKGFEFLFLVVLEVPLFVAVRCPELEGICLSCWFQGPIECSTSLE